MFHHAPFLALSAGALLAARAEATPQILAPVSLDRAPVVENVFIEDLDRDGIADLLLRDGSQGTLDWLRGTGGGDFRPPAALVLGVSALAAPSLGDIDGDGDRDLVYYDEQFRLKLIVNGANGLAGLPVDIGAPPTAVRGLHIGDVDGDGDGDVVYLESSGAAITQVSVAINGGSAGFSLVGPGLNFPSGSIVQMKVGDLNGDGRVDLAIIHQGAGAASPPTLVTALSTGTGVFGPPAVVDSIAAQTSVLLIADVTGDGSADLSVRSPSAVEEVRVYSGAGDGSFPTSFGLSTVGDPVRDLDAVDLDLDGTIDLVASTPSAASGESIQYFRGPILNGSSTPLPAALGSTMFSPVFGDVSGDGFPDAVGGVQAVKWQLGWLPHLGAGSPLLGPSIGLTNLVSEVDAAAAGDLNGDGDLELISVGSGGAIQVVADPLGPAYEVTAVGSLSSSPIQQILTVDLDSDGRDDVVTVDGTNTLRVSLSRASFDLVPSFEAPGVDGMVRVSAEDLLGDGALDLVAVVPNQAQIVAFEGLGGGAFSPIGNVLVSGGSTFSAVRVVDVDGDGVNDVAATLIGFTGGGGVVWYRGVGQGLYGSARFVSVTPDQAFGLEVADFSGDGVLDMAWFSSSSDEYRVALGQGGGQFAAPGSLPAMSFGEAELSAVDIDLDGALDLVSWHSLGGDVRVLRGDGAGGFTPGPLLQSWASSVAPVDLDGDGDVDLLSTRTYPKGIFFIENVEVNLVGASVCGPAVPNSSGSSAAIIAFGSDEVAVNALRLRASELPPQSFGLFLASQTVTVTFPVAGSTGRLCLGGSIGRLLGPGQVQSSGESGAVVLDVDLADLPAPGGSVAASAGQTWAFQTWFRDGVPGGPVLSNFTDAVMVTLR